MIEKKELSKHYGKTIALDGLDLSIARGELFVLLGPNGAGKTTTIKILTTLLRPTKGTAFVGGHSVVDEPGAVKALIGYVPDTPQLYDKLTGWEFLEFIADVRRIRERKRIHRLIEAFELEEVADALIETYSHGMKKKLAIVAALLHQPQALFLDEPTGGLDPRSARLVKDLLPRLCREGTTILMTTHILEIAEKMCDRVGILDEGRLRACGTAEDLLAEYGEPSLEDLFLRLTHAETPSTADIWNAS